MPKILLTRPHALPLETLRERMREIESRLHMKYGAETKWTDERTMRVSGPGVDGSMTVGAASVHIDIDLGFMLSPLKGKLEEGLGRQLDRLVSEDPAAERRP